MIDADDTVLTSKLLMVAIFSNSVRYDTLKLRLVVHITNSLSFDFT